MQPYFFRCLLAVRNPFEFQLKTMGSALHKCIRQLYSIIAVYIKTLALFPQHQAIIQLLIPIAQRSYAGVTFSLKRAS